eukprot:4320907-Alexandrium_andersonii.AAC.1
MHGLVLSVHGEVGGAPRRPWGRRTGPPLHAVQPPHRSSNAPGCTLSLLVFYLAHRAAHPP